MLKSPLDLHISKRLKIIRTTSGLTQTDLGSLVGVTSQQINKYESGVNKMHASRLYEISQILDKPISSFLNHIIMIKIIIILNSKKKKNI